MLTGESEKWIEDYTKFFPQPSDPGVDPLKICTLWSVAGVMNYYISAIEPYTDRNDNRHTLDVELTVNYLSIT